MSGISFPPPDHPEPLGGRGAEDLGLPFSREAEEAFLEVEVSVLMSLPDEENLPKVGPDAA